jgi:succinyl-diaminopimelate desuccinylase
MMNVIELAQKLIQFDSVTPKGADSLDFIQKYLEDLGFNIQRLPFGSVDNLFARKGNDNPHLMVVGHVDVVPTGDGWKHPPFAGVVENNILYGRGAADMKGAIAAFLAALADIQHKGSISVLLTTDEEGPAKDGIAKIIPWLESNNHIPDFALVGEPTSVHTLGDTIKNGRRGSISFDIVVHGRQGHVAYPHLAQNAANPLVMLLQNLTSHPLDEGAKDFDPSNLEIVKMNMPNDVYNIIPGVSSASINIRFNSLHNFKNLEERINLEALKVKAQYGPCEISVTALPSAEPFITHSEGWMQKVSKAVEAETGSYPQYSTSGGTSDARFIQKICPVLELGLLNKTAHHVDEHIPIADLVSLQKIYQRIFQE